MLGILVYFMAIMVVVNFLMRALLAHHADNPAAAGLAPLI